LDIIISKAPENENDSYLFTIKDFIMKDFNVNPYISLKREKFKNKDISKDGFDEFIQERGSLRFFDQLENLPGSIYTYSIQDRQNMSYEDVLNAVREIFIKNRDSRRAVLTMANPIIEYKKAELEGYDVSCLNLIHYLNNKVNLVFRSSDIQYELLADIVTIYEFFLMPIYGHTPIDIQIFGSTSQKVKHFDNFMSQIMELK